MSVLLSGLGAMNGNGALVLVVYIVIWQGFQKVEVTSNLGLFSIVERLDGNIPGAKGYWCGFGVSRSNTIIGK